MARFKIWGTLVQYAIDFEGGEEMGFGAEKVMKKLKMLELKSGGQWGTQGRKSGGNRTLEISTHSTCS